MSEGIISVQSVPPAARCSAQRTSGGASRPESRLKMPSATRGIWHLRRQARYVNG